MLDNEEFPGVGTGVAQEQGCLLASQAGTEDP